MTEIATYSVSFEQPPNSAGVTHVILRFTTMLDNIDYTPHVEIRHIEDTAFEIARWMMKKFGEVAVSVELAGRMFSFRLPVRVVAQCDLLAATWLPRQEIGDEDPITAWQRMFSHEV